MRKMVKGFVHRQGFHCGSTSLRDVFEFHGHKFSEDMVFGLNCGLGFVYWSMKRAVPPIFVGGLGSRGIEDVCRILGIKWEKKTTTSAKKAWQAVKELIDNDVPVMLQVDMFYLDFWRGKTGHFGGHAIVLAGYDEERGEAYVTDVRNEKIEAERREDGLFATSLESLAEARSSTFKPFPTKNAWVTFAFPKELVPLEKAIKTAIKTNAERFLNSPIKNFGVKGIRHFADQIIKWPDIIHGTVYDQIQFKAPFEIFEGGTLWTAMRLNSGKTFGLKLRSLGNVERPEIFCEVFSRKKLSAEEEKGLLRVVEWTLSLKEDIKEFYALAERDPLVKSLVGDLYGMRRTKRPDIFPSLVLAVTLQMAPIRRSHQMMNLLIKNYGAKIRFDGRGVLYWPSPDRIAKTDIGELEERCKLGYRAKILKGIAEALCKGFPTLRELEKMSTEEAKAKLMELKGIGEYSADIVSPHPGFALDIWSAKIFSMFLSGEETESPRSIIPRLKKFAEDRWGKWKGYVFTYVLNDLNNLSRRFNLNLAEL